MHNSSHFIVFGFILIIQAISLTFAQEPVAKTTNTLRDAVEQVRQEFKLPAIAGGIVTRDGLQEMAVAGVRKVGSDVLVTEDDLWHLGSCTKAMTATLIGILVHEGKLNWETTFADAFPDDAGQMTAEFRKITVMNLLTHRSGLPANGPWRALGDDRSPTEQRHELLRRMMTKPLQHEIGTTFLYSNVGYAIAGLIAETVTGQAWEILIQEKLFTPLGMEKVGFGIPGTIGEIDQPWGHAVSWFGLGPLKPIQADNAASLGPAGIVHASMNDWAKFIALHLQRNNSLIPDPIWQQLHTPPDGADYALGWGVYDRGWAGGKALSHSGSNTVNYCVCWLAPERGFAVIVATNTGQANAALAADKLASLLIKQHLSD